MRENDIFFFSLSVCYRRPGAGGECDVKIKRQCSFDVRGIGAVKTGGEIKPYELNDSITIKKKKTQIYLIPRKYAGS